MARPTRTIRSISKNIRLSEIICAKMELALYSDVEGRIPVGAQAALIEGLLKAHFDSLEASQPPSEGVLPCD